MRNLIKLFTLIFFSVVSVEIMAQTLTQARVYFDNNANGYQFVSIANQSTIDQPFTVDVSSLTRGVHVMYIEVKDNNGRWSFYDRENIHIQGGLQMATLGMAEYYFDNDPGFGQGIQIPIANNTISSDFQLDCDGLSNGMHMAYIRVRDNANQWSLYAQHLFQVVGSMNQEIVSAEYYFDNDPGFGNGLSIPLSDLVVDADLELSVDGLANGVHTLYVRVQDANGLWSFYDQANFTVTNPIPNSYLVIAEYYFDTDPGEGNAIPLVIPQDLFVDGDFELDIPNNLTNGNHTVCIRVLNGAGYWSTVSCETITICTIPIPSIVTSGNACTDGFVTLAVDQNIYDSYAWSGGGQGTSIQVDTPGVYTLTVNDNGCSAQTSIDAQFSVVPDPVVTITGNACPNGQQIISITNDYDSFTWQDSSAEPSLVVTEAGTYTVTLVSGECSSVETIEVTYLQPVAPVISLTGNACEGQAVTLSIPTNTPNVLWSNGFSTNSIVVTSSGTYSVNATNLGCPVSSFIDVNFATLPVVDISSTGGPCSGDIVTLQASIGYDTYLWNTGNPSSTIDVTTSGNYSVQVSNGNCSVTESIQVDFISIATPTISTNQNVLACDQAGVTYQWYLNGSPIPNATSQFYTATQSGFYAVEITQNGCSASSAVLNFTYIGVAEIGSNNLAVWPNPTMDVLHVQSDVIIENVQLFDVFGKMIYNQNCWSVNEQINLSDFAAGLYELKVKTPNEIRLIKVIVQ